MTGGERTRTGIGAARAPALAAIASLAAGTAHAADGAGTTLGADLPPWSALPFVGLLLSIALLPLLAGGFWRRHYPKVSAAWAAALAVPLLAAFGPAGFAALAHTAIADYLPFVVLLAALYTIGSGVVIRGTPRGSPPVNALILLTGTLLASVVGTTGATVLLIKPLLRANRHRRRRVHSVVFFIFLVANIGGSLTPLGDPPLFLGFLHGVPFFWTLGLWDVTLLTAAALLAVYLALDAWHWRREDADVRANPEGRRERLRIAGAHNLVFLAGVLGAVVLSGVWHPGRVAVLGVERPIEGLVRDAVLVAMAAGSWLTTPHGLRRENEHEWGPIREVAVVFAGIFVTMVPVLAMLGAGEGAGLGFVIRRVRTPALFFWATGGLSSVLDNAPTYLTSLSTALGRLQPGVPEREAITRLIADTPEYLRAVAAGAVLMGANTYIGNAPNFLARSIAESAGVRMPTFFGYVVRYVVPVLLPVYVLVTLVFFR